MNELEGYTEAKKRAELCSSEICRLGRMADAISSAVSTGKNPVSMSRICDCFSELEEKKSRYADELCSISSLLLCIQRKIDRLDSPAERKFLSLRYLDGLSYGRISTEMNYSERQIFNIRKKALESYAALDNPLTSK